MRSIVCTIGSPTYTLAKELVRVLTPLTSRTSTYIKNPAHQVEKLQTITIEESDPLVSFDVQSLLTWVPIDETLKRVAELLNRNENLEERTC